jgi:CheY-like chemotaxis protein
MPQGGRLVLTLSRAELDEASARINIGVVPGPYVKLSVADTGCGMDSETVAHLFEPFFTTKQRGSGTGLGLSLVYGIVRQSGGLVEVDSEPGRGTTFKVYFPRVLEASGPDPSISHPTPLTGSETVLLTEDEDEVRWLTKDILEMNGYTVLEASSGTEALRLSKSYAGEIHLLLTDVVMPGGGGGELARQIKSERPGIKILFMSGYPDDAMVRHGVLDADAAFIQKPFGLESMARKVRDVLDSDSYRASWP